jgi:hypothetical protein
LAQFLGKLAALLGALSAKLSCPSTRLAVGPGEPVGKGGVNRSTRLLFWSLIHRVPVVSAAMPSGTHNELALATLGEAPKLQALVLKAPF